MGDPAEAEQAAALECLGVSKHFGKIHAVRGVDLTVAPGEVHGLLGPNGAGKTTLLRMLLGLSSPDAGTVRLLGGAAGTAGGRVPGGVAGFASTPQLYPYLSGRRNLELLAWMDDGPAASTDARIDAALRDVGLTGDAGSRVAGYSAGMRQRLGLAAALLREPKLLLLDEPTSSLDPAAARDLRAEVRRRASEGVAVLWSSHDMAEVESLCATVTIVHHGRVVFSGTLDALRRQAPAGVHRLRTADDAAATSLAKQQGDGLEVERAPGDEGLDVRADRDALDRFVVALGRAGVAVRSLESRDRSLESLFLRLTSGPAVAALDAEEPPAASETLARAHAGTLRGARASFRVECAKLAAQAQVWAVLGVAVLAPFLFAAAMTAQSDLPEDTLFGRWVKASGYAVPLVVLGFAASWAFPVLTSVVAGDIFASEDRHGTWPALLTRSGTRTDVFLGKLAAAHAFTLLAITVLAASSIVAGLVLVGDQPLLGLSGTRLSSSHALPRVVLAWVSVLPPAFGFTSLALLVSVATRSSAAGVGLPVLLGFVMELASFLNGPDVVRRMMLTTPFLAWHGLFAEPGFYRPLLHGTGVSAVYGVASVLAAYRLFRRREMGA